MRKASTIIIPFDGVEYDEASTWTFLVQHGCIHETGAGREWWVEPENISSVRMDIVEVGTGEPYTMTTVKLKGGESLVFQPCQVDNGIGEMLACVVAHAPDAEGANDFMMSAPGDDLDAHPF